MTVKVLMDILGKFKPDNEVLIQSGYGTDSGSWIEISCPITGVTDLETRVWIEYQDPEEVRT